ncbi:hypothetical protein PISL3812_09985 [Talaromyces islandicus]|uniref:Methyltransferase domain-containing protein n=1 Tax=Talaromyces islandicus TaxID=28573 RepID=A0A0U1MBE1_TALIS|nr:hypothetical protein PISL3812_09985 [Talaromyces islandicus]
MSDSGVELDPQDRDNESTDSVDFEKLPQCIENNRLYPNEEYWLPTDDTERHRQRCEHDLFCRSFGERLYQCPKDPRCALDLGTGGGHWAIDFADKNRNAIVLGIDIDFQESAISCPPNAIFEIDDWWDLLHDGRNKNKFDVVHLGSLAG